MFIPTDVLVRNCSRSLLNHSLAAGHVMVDVASFAGAAAQSEEGAADGAEAILRTMFCNIPEDATALVRNLGRVFFRATNQ